MADPPISSARVFRIFCENAKRDAEQATTRNAAERAPSWGARNDDVLRRFAEEDERDGK